MFLAASKNISNDFLDFHIRIIYNHAVIEITLAFIFS
jgi:hypothetical protein